MAMIASLTKIAVLAAVLTCVGAVKPMPSTGSTRAVSDSKPAHLQCRMYFGCAPVIAWPSVPRNSEE
jgi:hypothetical protein